MWLSQPDWELISHIRNSGYFLNQYVTVTLIAYLIILLDVSALLIVLYATMMDNIATWGKSVHVKTAK